MSFVPPRCPNPGCPQHLNPTAAFYRRRGYYQPQCRDEPIPRFKCRMCERGFSRQTFRHDYRDHRPQDNVPVFMLLVSGVGLRQLGRLLKMNAKSVQGKQRKMARTFGFLHENLTPRLPSGRGFLLDEEETYEQASIFPLTMPVLIEKETWFVVATAVGSIRRLAEPGTLRRARQDLAEKDGPRPDESRIRVQDVLQQLARKVPEGNLLLLTDEKTSYVTLGKEVFGDRLVHEVTPSTLARGSFNPLFPINTTMAMTRDNCGRLRRRSWLVTKKAERLQHHLLLFTVYRNYVRRRFNHDRETDTPAKLLGLTPRHLVGEEVLAWRQDWAERSIHPMSFDGWRTVRETVAA
jgi:transposase-like protein